MHDENIFHAIADATLMHIFDQLEDAFESGALEELDLADGILTIETADAKTFVVSKHGPSLQLWLASPHSGGHHFSYDETAATWLLADGTALKPLLERELLDVAQVKVVL